MPGSPEQPLDPSNSVARWLATPSRNCHLCGQPIYPTDPRALDPDMPDRERAPLVHLECLPCEQPEAQST